MSKIFSDKIVKARQNKSSQILRDKLAENEALVVISGEPQFKPGGLDQQYLFLPLPDYYWLSGSRRSGGCIVYTLSDQWIHFEKGVTSEELVWEGSTPSCHEFDVTDLPEWLKRKKIQKLYLIGKDNRIETFLNGWLSEKLSETEQLKRESLKLELKNCLDRSRRAKDSEEIQLIERAALAAKLGFAHLKNVVRSGITERQIQIEFEYQSFKAGSEKVPYETIVGAAQRAAILHAIPTDRKVQSGDLVLVDAGADINDYCVDITRIFFADGSPKTQQKSIYDIVATAQRRAIDTIRPGIEWHEAHRVAAEVIGQGLIDLGILKGPLSNLLERGVVGLFFPHGIGHMLGQRVRDVGGHLWGRSPRKVYGTSVRVDLPMEENFLMTFEPGLYFIEALLKREDNKKKFEDLINWKELEGWMNIGGVRIEDDILIKSSGNVNLTAGI